MPEFIKDNDYQVGSFEYLLKAIQRNYGLFISLIQAFYGRFVALIPGLQHYVNVSDLDSLSHSLARCYTTRSVLDGLFGMSKWYDLRGLISDDMEFNIVSLSGSDFPDHTFIVLKFKGSHYILQSYYFSYLLSGKYGVIKLTDMEYAELNTVISNYSRFQAMGNSVNPVDIIMNNIALKKFTGIDSSRHSGNLTQKWGDNNIEIKTTFANSQCVLRYLQSSMNNFEDILFSEIGSADDIISLRFRYLFSDAFIPSAHPLLLHTNGRINALPDDQKQQVFSDLIGTDYEAGVVGGLYLGVAAHDKILSDKTIDVSVRDVGRMLNSIISAALPVIYQSRIENLTMCRAVPILRDVIILGVEEQLTKRSRVFAMRAKGILPKFIPAVQIAPTRHGKF